MVWSPWSQKYALLLLLSVHPLTFCISHLFCHAISWLWHEVVLSPWWEVCCREEPVHSWHLLKTKQAVYKYLFTMPYAFIYSGICWNRKRSFTHLITSTYSEISICTLLAFAEIKRGLLHTKPLLLTMTLVFVNSWHLLKQNRSLTHQVTPI